MAQQSPGFFSSRGGWTCWPPHQPASAAGAPRKWCRDIRFNNLAWAEFSDHYSGELSVRTYCGLARRRGKPLWRNRTRSIQRQIRNPIRSALRTAFSPLFEPLKIIAIYSPNLLPKILWTFCKQIPLQMPTRKSNAFLGVYLGVSGNS
jgi:hypothetical protein